MTQQARFPISPELTAMSLAYTNKTLVADAVLPRIPVSAQSFRFRRDKPEDGFTVPDTRVGRKSRPNEIEFSGELVDASCEDFGLEDAIPQTDLDAMPNEVDRSTTYLTDLIMLDREVRVANLVHDANQYLAGLKSTLSGTSQWSDYTNSDPVAAFKTAIDAVLMRPNIAVMGQAVFSALSSHPKMIQAVYGPLATSGLVKADQVAAAFGLQAVIVGEACVNTAKPGQAMVQARAWGKHCAFLHVNPLASTTRGSTFGFTGQFKTREAGSRPDANIGLRGGVRVRVGETVKEVIAQNRLGYLYTNAVA